MAPSSSRCSPTMPVPEPSFNPRAGDGPGFTAVVDEATPEGRGVIY